MLAMLQQNPVLALPGVYAIVAVAIIVTLAGSNRHWR